MTNIKITQTKIVIATHRLRQFNRRVISFSSSWIGMRLKLLSIDIRYYKNIFNKRFWEFLLISHQIASIYKYICLELFCLKNKSWITIFLDKLSVLTIDFIEQISIAFKKLMLFNQPKFYLKYFFLNITVTLNIVN